MEMLLPTDSGGEVQIKRKVVRRWPRKYQILLLAVLALGVFTLISSSSSMNWKSQSSCISFFMGQPDWMKNGQSDNLLPPLTFPTLSPKEYHRLCFPSVPNEHGIGHAYQKINLLPNSNHEACKHLWEIWSRIYAMNKSTGEIRLPSEFQKQVRGWLGNDDKLFDAVGSQDVYTVVNKIYGEASVYNMLRSKRPVSKPSMDPLEYIEQTVSSTKDTCDFCNFKDHTAVDVFGRIISTHSASASNTFKMAKFHGLFFPFGHHPLNIGFEALADLLLNTTRQWFLKAFATDPTQIYPILIWDAMPHAGASQVHPHLHGLLDSSQYLGTYGVLNAVSRAYFKNYGSNLLSDILLVHWALGMAVVEGEAAVVVPLTARKDFEYMLISPELNMDAVKLLFRVLQAYRHKLAVYCFSAGGSLPVMGSPRAGLPFLFRIGSRGDCSSLRSDVSSLELYAVNNINADLGKTLEALTETQIH